MGSTVRVMLLVCVLVLAGCNGFADRPGPGVGSGGGEPAANVTAAPVPTVKGTPTPGPQVAPGVTTTRVTNASVLAAAHEKTLENASLTIRRVTTYRYGNGEIARRETVTTWIGRNGRRLRVVERSGAAAESGETVEERQGTEKSGVIREAYWFEADRSVREITHANGTTTYGTNPPQNLVRSRQAIVATEATRLDALASGFETCVRPVGNGTDTRYRVRSVSEADGGNRTIQVGFVPVSSFSLIVSSRGLVEEYRLVRRLSVQRRGKPTKIVTRVRYTDVGQTTVGRPPWYERAVNTSRLSQATNASVN